MMGLGLLTGIQWLMSRKRLWRSSSTILSRAIIDDVSKFYLIVTDYSGCLKYNRQCTTRKAIARSPLYHIELSRDHPGVPSQ